MSARKIDHVIRIDPDGTAHCLWTDDLPLAELGQLEVTRASNIEFNSELQRWEVRLVGDPTVLFWDHCRECCLNWEHGYINRQIMEGSR